MPITASGYGSPGPIAATFGDNGFFCAIDASGKQEILCWDKTNKSSSSTPSYFSSLPSMATLSGGEGFMCGIISNSSRAYCWNVVNSSDNLVPPSLQSTSYSEIAAGKYHVCAIRGSYYSGSNLGTVECWEFLQTPNNSSANDVVANSSFSDPYITGHEMRSIVSGEGFSCGVVLDREGGVVCWGPKSGKLGVPALSSNFDELASGRNSVCGISAESGEVQCWGEANEFGTHPVGTRLVGLSAGVEHYCGLRKDDHGVECWGRSDSSSVPTGSGFLAIASSDFITCGVREADLVPNCWDVHGNVPSDYSPPLQLCSPGTCSPGSCSTGMFAFNASVLNEPDLTSLCVWKDLKICLPCGKNCSDGYFPSSVCSENADRICTLCSLCQNSSCWDVCGQLPPSSSTQEQGKREIKKLVVITVSLVSCSVLVLFGWCFVPHMNKSKHQESAKIKCTMCVDRPVVEAESDPDLPPSLSISSCVGPTQVFRLSELKDATHGFKEFNELGRGSFGFVYKAVLSDGRQVAVKRANAATIIHTNSRDFDAELEILINIRHNNIVNLLGYCAEMGERLLVYEFMPHGTLHDHLQGELSPLDWNIRLKISLDAARGLEYLHKEVTPPIVHRDVKTSNILLDSQWGARIADIGILSASDGDLGGDMESDVYSFGIVLLEILSGKKSHGKDCSPPGIVPWALPLIRHGKAAAIIDRNVALPINVEPLLKLADVAELALRENPTERPSMSEVVSLLDQIVNSALSL